MVKPDLSFLSNRGGFFNNGWLCWPGANGELAAASVVSSSTVIISS